MKNSTPSQGIPLGVHITSDGVAVVDMQKRDGSPSVRAYYAAEIRPMDGTTMRDLQIAALKTCIDQINTKTKACVLSVLPTQVLNKRFEVPKKANQKNIRSAADLEANEMATWSPEERIMSVDPLPGTTDQLISLARLDSVNAVVEVAREAGLAPIAVDAPLLAWQRSVRNPETDALLDLTYQRPALYIFADPIGEQILFPAAMDVDSLAEQILSVLVDFRSKQRIEVRTMRIVGNYNQTEDLIDFLKKDAGLDVDLLQFGDTQNPPWAYAVALATWSFAGTSRSPK